MTPDHLYLAASEHEKEIVLRSVYVVLGKRIVWSEMMEHLAWLRHAIFRWGTCDIIYPYVKAFLEDETTQAISNCFDVSDTPLIAPLPAAADITNCESTLCDSTNCESTLCDSTHSEDVPYLCCKELPLLISALQQCRNEMTISEEESIQLLWKDTVRSKHNAMGLLESVNTILSSLSVMCRTSIHAHSDMYFECQRSLRCERIPELETLYAWNRDSISLFLALQPLCSARLQLLDTDGSSTAFLSTLTAIVHLCARLRPAPLLLHSPSKFFDKSYAMLRDKLKSIQE